MTIYDELREAYRDLDRAETRASRLRDKGADTREADRHVRSYQSNVRVLEQERNQREREIDL